MDFRNRTIEAYNRVRNTLQRYRQLAERDGSLDSEVVIETDDPRCYTRFTCVETGTEIELVLQTPMSRDPYVSVALEVGDELEAGQGGTGFDAYDSAVREILCETDGYGYPQRKSRLDTVRTYELPIEST